jgi:hypothetical protein
MSRPPLLTRLTRGGEYRPLIPTANHLNFSRYEPILLNSGVMVFTKRLREGVRRGEITCSVRIWMRPHVKVGGRYPMDEGLIEIDSIEPIGFPDITPQLAHASGFLGVLDLLKVAKHGRGENIYLVRFHYIPPTKARSSKRTS